MEERVEEDDDGDVSPLSGWLAQAQPLPVCHRENGPKKDPQTHVTLHISRRLE